MKRTEARGREIRHEIQALRMIAVLAVVLFHFWPARVPGGFVGVDVFFVISGYLITSHLLSELRDSGRISFAAFYARRARRILPAATVVLLACLAGVIAISSMVDWQGFVGQILASTAFVENWWLAAASVDYLGATALPSPVQHYWSLSVEEQFYVLWPALLAGVYWATSRYLPGSSRRVLGIVLGLVATASLAFSILTTMSNPNSAFFNTAARFWELAAGGLLAYFGVSVSRVPAIRLVASLLGWALIAASLILFTAVTPFPGYAAALPVAGTVLVIWAGVPSEFRFWQVLNDNALVRHLAGTSFAAYLWHWPLLVFAQQLSGEALTTSIRLALLVATFVLAWLTTSFVENPIRFSAMARTQGSRFTLAIAGAAILLVALPSAATWFTLDRSTAMFTQAGAPGGSTSDARLCVGAQALDPASDCIDGPYSRLVPSPLVASRTISVLHGMGCASDGMVEGVTSCGFGDLTSPVKVVLVGDSHAMTFYPAIKRLAEQNHWHLVTFTKSSCAYTTAESIDITCTHWRAEVAQRLADEGPWAAVFADEDSGQPVNVRGNAAGFRAAWKPLVAAGSRIVVIRDNPAMQKTVRECVVANLGNLAACARPRSEALPDDVEADAARGQKGVVVVDLTPYYCNDDVCFVEAGGVLLYRDPWHLNEEYTATLAPYIGSQVAAVDPDLFAGR